MLRDHKHHNNPKYESLKQVYAAIIDVIKNSAAGSCEDTLFELGRDELCPSCGKERLHVYAWLSGESFMERDEIMLHYGENCESCGYRHHDHVTLDRLLESMEDDSNVVYDLEHVRVRMYPPSWMVGFEEIEWDEMERAGFSALSGEINLHFFDETRMLPLIISQVGYKSCSFHTLISEFAPYSAKKLLDRWRNKSDTLSIYISASKDSYEAFMPVEIGVWYLKEDACELESKLVEFPVRNS